MTEKTLPELLIELQERERRAEEGGGRARQLRHQRLGRLTVRERIDALLDAGSFVVAVVVVKAFVAVIQRFGFAPFAWYRIVAGAAALVWLGAR